ncbi:carbonic anhydrase [Nitrosomonas sp.]|uniref:carbonic anhydrase n=2 Tax=Nitrosomonas TaxID=914 RepID=UPI0025E47E26|nr:carbonic anhydrase [Nitrosomonas sp.]MBE7526270.1 twin-arginine translocation signal domain-containing protein [Burkholderiales bacterium]
MKQQKEQAPAIKGESRRKFMQLAALGGGVSLLTATSWLPEARAAGGTDALLLSCMDYRLVDDIERYMSDRGMRNKYDHVILAGASLGAITDKYPEWNKTFWEHLDIAIKLHNIHTVMVMDHRDCGAYKVILGAEHTKDPGVEKETHATHLNHLKKMISEKYPKLKVEMLLMSLDGTVDVIG